MNRERNWHSLDTSRLERIFRTDSATGLSQREADRRLRHSRNTVWEVKTTSAKGYAVRSFFDLCTVLLVLAVFSAALFGGVDMALVICIILAVGRGARIAVYMWAERVFERNARESLPRAKVVRGGTVKSVASDMVVPGDVLVLDSGDTVPCDIRITAADNVLVAEESVTGRKGIVAKNFETIIEENPDETPIPVRTNMLYASSAVISGFAIGIAVATGDDTLICTREGRISLAGEKDISTVEKLSDWGRMASLCMIAAALVITVVGITLGGSTLSESFLPSIAMAASGLSEYIAAIGAFAWAHKLKSEGGCVLTRASVAEKAANIEIMALRSVNAVKSAVSTFHSYFCDSKLTLLGTPEASPPSRLLRLAYYCTGASPEGGIVEGNFGTRQRSAGALSYRLVRSIFEEHCKGADPANTYSLIQHMGAGDRESFGVDNVLLARGNEFYYCAMGSVSRILSMSTRQRRNGESAHLTDEDRRSILAYEKELKKHGVTLCAVGFRTSHFDNLKKMAVLQSNLCFEGFIAVSQRPCEGTVEQIQQLRYSGARMVIFSENGEEDRLYAEAEGIFVTGDTYLPAEESVKVRSLSFDEGSLALVETPQGTDGVRERLRFMKIMSESGLSVSYVGYSPMDMWNIKRADVAFAVSSPAGVLPQGIRTEAHGVAVSEGGGFDGVCKLIGKCRSALSNIRNILKFLIVSHVARLVLMLLSAAAGLALPGAASLIIWGVIVDFAVAFAMATVPGEGTRTRLRRGRVSATPDSSGEVILPTMYGALLAILSVSVPFLSVTAAEAAGVAPTVTPASLMTCSVVSCMMALPLIGAEMASGYGLFSGRSKLSASFVLPAVLTLLSVVALLFLPGGKSAFGTEFAGWIMTAFTLLPSAVIIAVMSIVRAVRKK